MAAHPAAELVPIGHERRLEFATQVTEGPWANPNKITRAGRPSQQFALTSRPAARRRTTTYRWPTAHRRLECADLDVNELARRSVPPSTMSLLGLVRHMSEVERHWFRREMAAQDAPKLYCTDENPDGDWDGAVPETKVADEAWQSWRAEVAFAEQFVADATDLDMAGTSGVPLRDVLVHMIEEYARHCGHADLLRERIDGRVGQ